MAPAMTRWPSRKPLTAAPSLSITPTGSWPTVRPLATGYSPLRMWTSVPQIVVVVTRRSASSGPTSGTGFPSSSMRPGPTNTAAFIILVIPNPPVPPVPAPAIGRRSVRRARALAAPPAGRSLRRPRDRMPDRLRGPGRLIARLDVASLHGRGPARPGRFLGLLSPLTLGREPVPLREAVGTAFALPHRVRTLTDFHLEFVVHLDQPLYLP